MDENIIIQGLGVEISEDKSDPDCLNAKFCVCDFDTNHNSVSLNRETIDEWVSTLVGTPLVAKITKNLKGKNDFGSHEMKIISHKDKQGKVHKRAVFDTSAFGVCTDVSIDTAKMVMIIFMQIIKFGNDLKMLVKSFKKEPTI